MLQFVDANDVDDESEYDDAMSRMGSMSMSSAYSSDDDTSPVNRLAGSPGRPTEVGCPFSAHFLFSCLHSCSAARDAPMSLFAPTLLFNAVICCSPFETACDHCIGMTLSM